MNPHNWIYLFRICPCSLAGVVERSPLWVPGSAFRSPAETTMLEGSSFSVISSNESSDFLKFSELVGTYTEKSDVLLSRVSATKMANGTKIRVFVIHGFVVKGKCNKNGKWYENPCPCYSWLAHGHSEDWGPSVYLSFVAAHC